MAGKKGMRWGKNRRKHSLTVKEALAKNESRLPILLDDLYELALDIKASRKERMEALKFLIDKAAPKSSYEPFGQGYVPVGDEYARQGLAAVKKDLEDRKAKFLENEKCSVANQ